MGERGGFVVLWRKALDSWLFELPDLQFKIAMRILLEANWKATTVFRRGQRLVIGRGQLILSEAGFAKRCGCSRGAVRRTLNNLEKVGFLSLDTSPGCTVVTILNYDRYQDKPTEASPEPDPRRAQREPEADPTRARSEQGNKGTREQDLPPNARARVMAQHPEPQTDESYDDQQRIIELWTELFANASGSKPRWGLRELTLADKLARHGFAEVEKRARRLFESPPHWLKPPFTIANLDACWDYLVEVRQPAVASYPEVPDL